MKKRSVLATALIVPFLSFGCSSKGGSTTDSPGSTDPGNTGGGSDPGKGDSPGTGTGPGVSPGSEPGTTPGTPSTGPGASPGSPASATDPTAGTNGPMPTCTPLPLKTPRAPKLLWTCERQNFYEKNRAQNTPHWRQLVNIADRTGTANSVYGDNGDFAAIVYQVTGDVTYAQKASAQLRKRLTENAHPTGNYTRELEEDFAIIYDWIQGGIPQAEKTEIENGLYSWVDQILAGGQPGQPVRLTDSDQTTGNYFGMILTALATPDNPRSQQVLNNSFIGGLDSPAAGLTNMRNTVRQYMEWAKGGVWIESAYYDIETLQLLGEGVEAVRTATGVDHFPEFAGLAEAVVRSQIEQLTPDLNAAAKWGDLENAREVQAWRRYQVLGMFTGLLPMNSALKPYATKLVNDLKAQYPNDQVYRARFWYYFDPLSPTADWRTDMPKSHFASGQGLFFAHDGFQTSDSLFFSQMRRPPMGTDHENNQFGDFGLYRKGRWVLTRPLGYTGGADDPEAVNAMVIGGLDSMIDRGVIAHSQASDGSYAYIAGTTKGDRYSQPFYQPPPSYLSEWTRSLVYLPTKNKSADTVVVYDRVNATAPTHVDDFLDEDTARINAAPAVKQFLVHTLEQPTTSATGATWNVGEQKAELTALAPAQRNARIVDEKAIASWPTDFPPASERHYYVSLSPTTTQPWDTFLNVLQFADATIASKPTRLASTDGGMEGARVTRPGQADAIVLFSASQATRVRASGFSLQATLPAGGAELYIADLDPAKTWTVGGAAITVDASGFGHAVLSGTGAVTIDVAAQ